MAKQKNGGAHIAKSELFSVFASLLHAGIRKGHTNQNSEFLFHLKPPSPKKKMILSFLALLRFHCLL